jgi:PIN domain nuclease of toxin-antitoxin system
MNYLLDTCSFIWLTTEPSLLSAKAASLINDRRNAIFLSDLSIWEISLKTRVGKLSFPEPLRVWVPKQRNIFRLLPLPIHEEAIYQSENLADVHRDPYDRLLAAQTIQAGMTVITPDLALSNLGAKRVW